MPKTAAAQARVPLDRTDLKLIRLLQKDGRLANADLAKAVNLTPTPCLRRIREMESSGLITGYRVTLNRRKAGFGIRVFVGVLRDRDVDRHQMWRHIELFPEIIGCYVVSGEFDLLLDVVAEDLDAYSNVLLEKIMKIPGVQQTRSMFILREITSDAPIPVDALTAL
jgi:Lrp/AsnC family leucine-responsive transcriptional regulator